MKPILILLTTSRSLAMSLLLVIFVGNYVVSQEVYTWRNIGLEYLGANMPEKAIPFYKQAAYASPINGVVRTELAYAYQLHGEYVLALDEYTLALGLANAPIADIKYNMGLIYSIRQEWGTAAQYFTEAITLDEHYSEAYLNRAIVQVYLQSYKKAEKDFVVFLEKEEASPKRPEIEEMIALLAKYRDFPVGNLDKDKYNEKKTLEEQLNKNRERLYNTPNNQFLVPSQ